MWTAPTVSEFKAFFVRDFKYAKTDDPENLEYVIDADIQKAIDESSMSFNEALFSTDAQKTLAYLWLAAYFMVQSLNISSQGLNSKFNFPVNSTSAGPVSVGYTVPDKYMKNAFLASLTANGYGMKYASMIIPRMVGGVVSYPGGTHP